MIYFLRYSLDWLVRIFRFCKKLVIIVNRTVMLDLKIDTRTWNIYIYCNFNKHSSQTRFRSPSTILIAASALHWHVILLCFGGGGASCVS